MTVVLSDAEEQGKPDPEFRVKMSPNVWEQLGRALLALGSLGEHTFSLAELGREVDRILTSIMHLPNLFICLVEEVPPSIRFVYCRDEHDRPLDRPLDGLGLTDQVYLKQRSVLLRRSQANALLEQGKLVNHGVPSLVWLGTPLKTDGKIRGVMATQDYRDHHALTEEHEACFNAVAPLVATLVDQAARRESHHADRQIDPARSRQKKALIATMCAPRWR